jgi:glycosyltransferase involved in cell wall biosynthesis
MKISAVVCTYQRPDILHRSLRSLAAQTLSPSAYEVIVVFDRTDDETGAVVDEYETDIDNLERCHDDGRGLSHARNVGFEAAEGEYVAFLDDDASADPEWLNSHLRTFETVSPTPDCVGGPVRPEFETAVPWWMPPSLPGLPVRDFGEEARWLTYPDERVIGANMAYPRQFLVDAGGFPTDLGRKDGTLLSNEETVLQAASAAGAGIYYQPDAGVDHFIESRRLTLRYLLERHYWQGISDCRVDPATVAETGDESSGRSIRESVPRAVGVFSDLLLSGEASSYVMAGLWTAYIVGFARERFASTVAGIAP